MKERLEIVKALGYNAGKRLINSKNEVYVVCIHILKFHMFTNTTNSSTDKKINLEKGIKIYINSPAYFQGFFSSENSVCMYINTEFIDILNDNHDTILRLAIEKNYSRKFKRKDHRGRVD